jgi:hypothetical protein
VVAAGELGGVGRVASEAGGAVPHQVAMDGGDVVVAAGARQGLGGQDGWGGARRDEGSRHGCHSRGASFAPAAGLCLKELDP